MVKPFSYLRDISVEFFDEGSSHGGALLTAGYKTDLAFGAIETMVEASRELLAEVPEEGIRGMLWFADALIGNLVNSGTIRPNGEVLQWDAELARKVSRVQLIPLVLDVLGKESVWIGDDGYEPIEVTPARFCAAFVLRSVFSCLDFGYTQGIDDLPMCYLAEASQVFGYLTILSRGEHGNGMADVVSSHVTRQNLSRLQDARHEENRQMEQQVKDWWVMHKDQPGMTKDRAADQIAGKVVPLKWRTVRDHLKGI